MALIISIKGYQFGFSDHAEVLPLILHQANKELYANDLYIQTITHIFPHERWLFCVFIALVPGFLAYKFFFIYIIFAYFLIVGLLKLNLYLSSSILISTFSTLGTIILMDGINTGGNELFYNFLVPSLVAKALCVWGWYFFLIDKPKYTYSYVLWSLASFAQPLVGAQCFFLGFGIQVILFMVGNPWRWHFLLWLGLAGPWIVALIIANNKSGDVWDFLLFRDAHHYYPASFPTLHLVVVWGLALIALASHSWNQKTRILTLLIIGGAIIYTIGIQAHSSLILKTQWFKTTIWLEAIGVLGFLQLSHLIIQRKIWFAVSVLSVFILFTLVKWSLPPYHFPWLTPYNDEIRIAQEAKKNTPIDAVFVVPFDFSAFRYFSERSIYVDYKSVAHHGLYFQKWQPRIQKIYGLELKLPGDVNLHKTVATQNYNQRVHNEISSLPIDYVILDTIKKLEWPLVAQAGRYNLYKVKH